MRLGCSPASREQFGARRPVGLIAAQGRHDSRVRQCGQRSLGTLDFGQGEGAVDGDNGRTGQLDQGVVELQDRDPVVVAASTTFDMRRLQGCLELVAARRAVSKANEEVLWTTSGT